MADFKQRLALVIGISEYQDEKGLRPLPNAVKDANGIADYLEREGGFQVTCCMNPSRQELLERLDDFRLEVEKEGANCIAVMFYAGHGFVDKDNNNHYMVSRDWDNKRGIKSALSLYGCSLDGDTGALSTMYKAYAGIALFDACRIALPDDTGVIRGDTEATISRGWGSATPQPTGGHLLACYASAPRRVASDGISGSPFADALCEHLCNPKHRNVTLAVSAANTAVAQMTANTPVPQVPQMTLTDNSIFDGITLYKRKLQGVEVELSDLLQRVVDSRKRLSVRRDAAGELWGYTYNSQKDANVEAMLKLNALQQLVKVLEDDKHVGDDGVCGYICNIFQNLATRDDCQDKLIQYGAVPPVIELFSLVEHCPTSYERRAAWGALGNLLSESGKEMAVAGGGVQQLIKAITTWGDDSGRCNKPEDVDYLKAALEFLKGLIRGHNKAGDARRIASSSAELHQFLASVTAGEHPLRAAGEKGEDAIKAAEILHDWLTDVPPVSARQP